MEECGPSVRCVSGMSTCVFLCVFWLLLLAGGLCSSRTGSFGAASARLNPAFPGSADRTVSAAPSVALRSVCVA